MAEGSAVVARLAALGWRVRYESPVAKITTSTSGCTVLTHAGEFFECDAVVSAVPSGPFRDLHIEGVSAERLASMYAIRHAVVSKIVTVYADSFWEANGQNGSSYNETAHFGGTWSQRNGILSALRRSSATAWSRSPGGICCEVSCRQRGRRVWPGCSQPQEMFVKKWGGSLDPGLHHRMAARRRDAWARCTPPTNHRSTCGSDQWVCGYMEGAVRSGLSAAQALLCTSAADPTP